VLVSSDAEDVPLSLSKHRPERVGMVRREVTGDDDIHQSFQCIACTRVHLVNLKTGKVLGEDED
jgi:hypothetical protein